MIIGPRPYDRLAQESCIILLRPASKVQESWVMAIMLLFFILFGSLTVMNMLLGVLVEAF